MADDGRIAHKPFNVARRKLRDTLELEIRESRAKAFPLAQDREPAQTGLESFETDLLEQASIVDNGKSPLMVMVGDVELVVAAPPAALPQRGCAWSLHGRILAERGMIAARI